MQLASRRLPPAVALAMLARLLAPGKAAAETRFSTKVEKYDEENGRIEITTFGFLVEVNLHPSLAAKGEFVYDAISGATPTGGPPLPGSDQVPLALMEDKRRAGVVELSQRWGRNLFSPQISYSTESDYESIGLAFNYSLELNEKNTTLLAGVARNFDRILPGNSFLAETRQKDVLDLMLGVNQLLGPSTVLAVNATIGFAEGYLSDPYKGVRFEWYPFYEALFPENRPEKKDRQVGYVSLTQYVAPANAAAEAAYRLSHDSFGILSHTASLEWRQKLGRLLVLTPFARYYRQSAADFYGLSFPGDPSLSTDGVPNFYSSDYRLSEMETWTYGLKAVLTFDEKLALEAGYKRYEMRGLDHATSASAYPSANIFTIGLTLWF